MKRFYKIVSTQAHEGGWRVLLDGKPVKTPMRSDLLAPSEEAANLAMQEWAAQEEMIDPQTMPITQLISTQLDRVSAEREAMTAAILKYFDTDLVCYRVDMPEELAARQAAAWDPALAWFEARYGSALLTTTEIQALTQPEQAREAVRKEVEGMDDAHFTILQLATPVSGSLVLALRFVSGDMSGQEVLDAARIEEAYKAEIYDAEKHGPDPAQDKKDKAVLRDLLAAEAYLKCLKLT